MSRKAALAMAAILGALVPSAAHAQSSDDRARADQLFHEGTAFLAHGNDADACDRFARSKALQPAVGVSLYLGDCLQRIGKTASAWKEFQEAESLAAEKKDKRAALAHARAAALGRVLDRVTIEVPPDADPSLRVTLDGADVAKAGLGTGIPVDPGHHVVVARVGQSMRVFETTVGAGNPTASVSIAAFEDEAPAAAPPPAPAPVADSAPPREPAAPAEEHEAPVEHEAPAPGSGGASRVWWGVGLASVGVAGFAVGTGFGLAAKSAQDQSNAGPCDASNRCTPEGLSLRQDALHRALASTVAFGVGAAALAASAIVVFALPHDAKLTVSPATTARGAGARVAVSF